MVELSFILAFELILIILSYHDLKYRLLPNKIIYPSLIFFGTWRFFNHPLSLWNYLLGFIIGGSVLFIAAYFSKLKRAAAFGGGDIKLMSLVGLALGVKHVVLTLLFSLILAAITSLLLVVFGRIRRDGEIPFGPFIMIATVISILFGDMLLSWYFGWSAQPM